MSAEDTSAPEDRLFVSDEAPSRPVAGLGADAPLAVRMRPADVGDVVGQSHLLGPETPLRVAIESGHPHSAILFGPPGTGKTTLARIIATAANGAFEEESAVNAGRAEVRAVIGRAQARRKSSGTPTIFFLDEIHRFNKAQQDALLPAVEDGLVTLIGATTENPYFEVNSALLSRTQIYELKSLDENDILALLQRALADPERGIAEPPEFGEGALELLAARSGGDARTALAALERAVETATRASHPVDIATAQDALQRKAVRFDREGDQHFDYISAWIKATRGSDPDASLYYLAVMLEGGEEPRFIARRMVVLASEDIGNADPQALVVANAAAQAVDRIGLPECRINLAQAAIYLALAPKSNASYVGLEKAVKHVRDNGAELPPDYLRDGHYSGARQLGRGQGYEYPHNLPAGVSGQPLLPEAVQDSTFYEPTIHGHEAKLGERLEKLRELRAKADRREGQNGP